MITVFIGKINRSQSTRSMRARSNDIFLSQSQPGPSSQTNVSLTQSSRSSSQIMNSQDMEEQEKMQLISNVIRYLFAADKSKQPIQKTQIVKNVLNGNNKLFRMIIEKVNRELYEVYLSIHLINIIYIYIYIFISFI